MKVPGIRYVQGRNAYRDQDGKKYGIAIHNTSNNASAQSEASYAQVRTDGVSSHFYVDGVEVIQSLDTNSKAGHAGSTEGNENAIAVEIVGFNSRDRAWWLANVDWDQLGYALAQVILHDPNYRDFVVARATVTEMRANPRVRKFYSHNDMRLAWGGTTHDDPGPNFPWDRLLAAVSAALNPEPYEGETMRYMFADDLDGITPEASGRVHVTDGLRYRIVQKGAAWRVLMEAAGAGPIVEVNAANTGGATYQVAVGVLCGKEDPGEDTDGGGTATLIPHTHAVAAADTGPAVEDPTT